MFWIYGTKRYIKTMQYTPTLYRCMHCNNVNKFSIDRSRLWFTLFFIPIIPLNTKYFMDCPICAWGDRLSKKDARTLIDVSNKQET